MGNEFKDKVALVTGAGKGIGRAITVALAAGGATVHAISRTKEDLDSLKQEIPAIHTYVLDISDWDETRDLVQSLGPIHLLVNNAGVSDIIPFLETNKEQLSRHFTVNTEAAFNISQVVAASMVKQGSGGKIVNISSNIGVRPCADKVAYCMSKAALNMMTKCMALELRKHKIRANAILPGLVRTQLAQPRISQPGYLDGYLSQTPLNKLTEIKDVVDATLFLLSDKSDMITGCLLPVEGGNLL